MTLPMDSLATKLNKITDDSIVIMDDVRRMPIYGEPYISQHCIICLSHSGSIHADYDGAPVHFQAHEVAIIYPHHIIVAHESSEDYLATLIVISEKMLKGLSNWHAIQTNRFAHEVDPDIKLTDPQYQDILDILQAMRCVSKLESNLSSEMTKGMLNILMTTLTIFQKPNLSDQNNIKSRLSSLLYEAIHQYCHQHHEVAFYADLFNLSPKHFSSVIKKETGYTASHWISLYLIDEAKFLLRSKFQMPIQEIGFQLGFEDQATFCRYFKNKTGESPSAFRHRMR